MKTFRQPNFYAIDNNKGLSKDAVHATEASISTQSVSHHVDDADLSALGDFGSDTYI